MTREVKKWEYEIDIISFIINWNKDRNCCTALAPVSRPFQADLQLRIFITSYSHPLVNLTLGERCWDLCNDFSQ